MIQSLLNFRLYFNQLLIRHPPIGNNISEIGLDFVGMDGKANKHIGRNNIQQHLGIFGFQMEFSILYVRQTVL